MPTHCIHTYPHGEGIDPSVTKLRLSLILDEEWQNISSAFVSETSRAVGMPDRRFLIQLLRDGVVAEERQFTIPYDEVKDNRLDLPNIFTLDSRSCTIAVWSDFINPDTGEALAYDISSPSQIVTTAPHGRDIYTGIACRAMPFIPPAQTVTAMNRPQQLRCISLLLKDG